MAAKMGQAGPGTGPYDPKKKENVRANYMSAVQADINKKARKMQTGKKTTKFI